VGDDGHCSDCGNVEIHANLPGKPISNYLRNALEAPSVRVRGLPIVPLTGIANNFADTRASLLTASEWPRRLAPA